MIKIKAIQEDIEKVKMIVSDNKCFCLDFNKLKEKLLIFFNNKTFEQIKDDKKCCRLKKFDKIKKLCKSIDNIKTILSSDKNIFKIRIDKCQRVIGYFSQQQNIDYFYIFLYDPFHQYNIIESNANLNETALKHIYDFLQISDLSFNAFNEVLKQHENEKKKHKKRLSKNKRNIL